jgi:hypothetical protein
MNVDVQATEQQTTPVYVSGTAARKLTGFSWGKLQRLGLIGQVGVELQPGAAPRYRLEDLRQLAVGA